jgi:hypothetical protein
MIHRTFAVILLLGAAGPCGGSSGSSVTSSALLPGDAHCPAGGSAFDSSSGTTYACSAPFYTGSAGVAVSGSVLSLDTSFTDGRYLRASADAGGPRVVSSQFDAVDGSIIHVVLTAAAMPGSVSLAAFTVTARDTSSNSNAWVAQTVTSLTPEVVGIDPAIAIKLGSAPAPGTLVRIIVSGTGPSPILGATSVPLAGAVGGPPGTAVQGVDYVTMLLVS